MYPATLATVATVAAAGAGIWLALPQAAESSARSCAAGYAYAGVAGRRPSHGLVATIVAAPGPAPSIGHVAAWVGLGGRGLGPSGGTEWIQAGLNSLPGVRASVYAEIARAGHAPTHTAIAPVRTNLRYRIAVVMEPGERWIVRVNGRRVAGPVRLPGSASWRPVATAESWLPTAATCNSFGYRFENVESQAGSSAWTPLTDVDVLGQGRQYGVARTGASFLATSL